MIFLVNRVCVCVANCRYGLYHVEATVWNNVSMILIPITAVRVGEDISALDVYVSSPLVEVDQTVTLTIQVCVFNNQLDALQPAIGPQ